MEFIKNNKRKIILYFMLGSIALIFFIMFVCKVAKLEVLQMSATFRLTQLDSPLIAEIAVPLMVFSGAFIPFKKGVLDRQFKEQKDIVKYCAIGAMVANVVGIALLLMTLFDSITESGVTYTLVPTVPTYIAVALSLGQIACLAYVLFIDKELFDNLVGETSTETTTFVENVSNDTVVEEETSEQNE